jgi:transposase
MSVPRPKVSAEQMEARRRQALQLLGKGYSLNKVSRMIGSAASSVMRWRATLEAGGEEALKVRFSPGRPSSLSPAERERLVAQLLQGAMASGFSDDLWTTERVAIVIHRYCKAQFHRSHVVRLMHNLGFQCQESGPEPRTGPRREMGNGDPAAGYRQRKLRGWVRVPHV